MVLLSWASLSYGNTGQDSLKVKELEEVVISSIRVDEGDPITQTTISLADIERNYVGQDAAVMLENLAPSIISYSDAGAPVGNYSQFRLRGIDQSRINITLNGTPLNDMLDQGVFFSNFSDFGNSAQSVQIQRGVGTSTNGTASYAGSVNFESIRLNRADPSFNFQTSAGSFGTYRASGELHTGKLQNNMAVYSRFTRTQSNGYKTNSGSDAYSFFLSGGFVGDKEVVKLTAFAGKTENDQSYLPVLRSDIALNPKTNYNSPNDTDNFEQELVQLQYSRILSSTSTFNATLYHGHAEGVFPFGLDPTTQLLFGLENNHYGIITDYTTERERFDFTAGLHGYIFNRENFNSQSPNTSSPTYEDETGKNEISVFAKAGYAIGALRIFADIQLRRVDLTFKGTSLQTLANVSSSSRDWLFFNPKIGLNYTLNEKSSVYASFGRTGREPTRTDILQGDGSGIYDYNVASAIDENIVKAEYVNDLEVGYRYTRSDFKFVANYFMMSFSNEISLVGALAARSYVALRQNVDQSTRSGVEFTTEWKPENSDLSIGFFGTYLTTNVKSFTNANGETLQDIEHIFAPKWILNPYIRYGVTEKLNLSVTTRYVDKSFMELSNDAEFELPSYTVVNAQIDYAFSDKVKLSVLVNNLFDKLYFNDGAPVDADFDGNVEGPGFRIQPPRHYYATLNITF